MPVVRVEQRVAAPVDAVWGVVSDVEARTRLMGHMRSVEVRETGPGYRVTAWEVDIKGCAMRWTEREEIDHERLRIDYHLIEGDLAQMEGHWQLEPLPDGVVNVVLSVSFDIGMPELSDMLDPVAERAIRENSLAMLASLAAHTGAAVV
jgi:ribosome-associated toxin RatA of RatAB toxin-antitoxin module